MIHLSVPDAAVDRSLIRRLTALAHPASFRSRVAADIAGLNRRSSRQLSANFAGSG
jgi:hypothetical protein